MNRGLLLRSLRETLPATLLFGGALFAVEAVFAIALPAFERSFAGPLLQLPFFQGVIQALLGVDAAESAGFGGLFTSIAWVHPVVLALVWAHAIGFCTRIPAGEVDRGTIDILLGLPVGRWQLYFHESLVWIASALAVSGCAGAGSLIGMLGGGARIPLARLALLVANLFCLSLVVGGFAWMSSTLADRRGHAIGSTFAAVLSVFLVNYLGQFWTVAARVSFLTPLHYYGPLRIIREGTVPAADILILLAASAVFWLAGGIIFSRRDLVAV